MAKASFSLRVDLANGNRFGPGKAALLNALLATGSIKSAASDLGMSYPRALKLIEQMNQSFAEPLVITQHGGADGGGTRVSEAGRSILALYRQMCAEAEHANRASLEQWIAYLRE
ncbi:MAG: LysR family transcriptional regulator [Pseudomonadota bacterium]